MTAVGGVVHVETPFFSFSKKENNKKKRWAVIAVSLIRFQKTEELVSLF